MKFGPIITVLKVDSMDSSLDFYTRLLGFDVSWTWSNDQQFEGGAVSFACITCGEAVLFLSEDDGGSQCCIFVEVPFVDLVDKLAESISRKSVELLEKPNDQPWGSREFLLNDPDGHTLRFSCPCDRNRK